MFTLTTQGRHGVALKIKTNNRKGYEEARGAKMPSISHTSPLRPDEEESESG